MIKVVRSKRGYAKMGQRPGPLTKFLKEQGIEYLKKWFDLW